MARYRSGPGRWRCSAAAAPRSCPMGSPAGDRSRFQWAHTPTPDGSGRHRLGGVFPPSSQIVSRTLAESRGVTSARSGVLRVCEICAEDTLNGFQVSFWSNRRRLFYCCIQHSSMLRGSGVVRLCARARDRPAQSRSRAPRARRIWLPISRRQSSRTRRYACSTRCFCTRIESLYDHEQRKKQTST